MRVNIEILIWSSGIAAVSFPGAVCERLSAVFVSGRGHGVELIDLNPSKTAPWNMNDSCRVLLVPEGRSCDSRGVKVRCSRSLSALDPWREIKQNRQRESGFARVKTCSFSL